MIRDGHLLLAHFVGGRDHGWTLPGGGLDHGEDPADAVVREVEEETGYDSEIDRLLGVDSVVFPGRSGAEIHGVRVMYEAHVTGGSLRHEVDNTTDRAQWFPLDALPEKKLGSLIDTALRLYENRPETGRLTG